MPLKCLSNFLQSLELPLTDYKVELKLRWKKHCVLASADVENGHSNSNNIIITIKDIKLYVPVVTLSEKDNQKLSKPISKGFKKSVYWNEYKTKNCRKKNVTNEYRYFLGYNFVGVN